MNIINMRESVNDADIKYNKTKTLEVLLKHTKLSSRYPLNNVEALSPKELDIFLYTTLVMFKLSRKYPKIQIDEYLSSLSNYISICVRFDTKYGNDIFYMTTDIDEYDDTETIYEKLKKKLLKNKDYKVVYKDEGAYDFVESFMDSFIRIGKEDLNND